METDIRAGSTRAKRSSARDSRWLPKHEELSAVPRIPSNLRMVRTLLRGADRPLR